MAAAVAILVIAVFSLLAVIAKLKNKKVLAVALVVLVGVLIGNAPGVVGLWSEATATFVYNIPDSVAAFLEQS